METSGVLGKQSYWTSQRLIDRKLIADVMGNLEDPHLSCCSVLASLFKEGILLSASILATHPQSRGLLTKLFFRF